MTIKNILILGSSAPGALETLYKQGFEKWGATVDTFGTYDRYLAFLRKSILNRAINKLSADLFYKPINAELLRFLNKKRYDVILVFKGMEIFPETIRQLKNHATITANYNADHPYKFYFPGSGNQHVVNSIPHYDVHFSYAKKIVEQLQQNFHKQAYCIPFGYNSTVNAFPGHANDRYANRVLFIGAFDGGRVRYLNRLHSNMVDIYGETKWKSRSMFRPYIRQAYQNRSLYGKEYVEAITRSMGVLNLLREQNLLEDSHNMRSFEVPGYGGLLISQRTGEQTEYFEENKEAVFFDSAEELHEKLVYLAAHPAMVQQIKQAAYNRSVRAGYSYHQRSAQLLRCLEHYF